MIDDNNIKKLAVKYETTDLNTRREYVQNLFLSAYYRQKQSANIFFKGGTALRLVFGSPRFSEDLDFSAPNTSSKIFEETILSALTEIDREGMSSDIETAKSTSGGYLVRFVTVMRQYKIFIDIQISKRKLQDSGEFVSVASDYIPTYGASILNRTMLFEEKIRASFERSKPRDFFDIYFLIRSRLLSSSQKAQVSKAKSRIATKLKEINFDKELKIFLPKSHHPLIKDFPASLIREIDRYA